MATTTAVDVIAAQSAKRAAGFRVWVRADSSGNWASNGLQFDDRQSADDWGFNLSMRWTAVRDYQVCAVGEDPNRG